jgi:hypothetical protein
VLLQQTSQPNFVHDRAGAHYGKPVTLPCILLQHKSAERYRAEASDGRLHDNLRRHARQAFAAYAELTEIIAYDSDTGDVLAVVTRADVGES